MEILIYFCPEPILDFSEHEASQAYLYHSQTHGEAAMVLPRATPGDHYLRTVPVNAMAPSAANRPSVVALTQGHGGASNVKFAAQKFGGQIKTAPPQHLPQQQHADPFAHLPHKSVTSAELEREILELNDAIDSQRNSAASTTNRRFQEVNT